MESEFGTQDILTGRGLGLGGFGYGFGQNMQMGNSVLAAEAHANGTATDANLTNLTAETRLNFDSVQEQVRESRTLDQFTALNKSVTDQEFRSLDRQRDIEHLVLDGQKEAALCCCEAKLEGCKNTAELKAEIIAQNALTREQIRGDALSAANAELTALKTQIACGCCGCGRG